MTIHTPVTAWHILFTRDYETVLLYLKIQFIEYQTGIKIYDTD